MTNKTTPTVLITGATGGIGYATAQRFLTEGAHVILHGPTVREAENAVERLVAGGAALTSVRPFAADFAALDDVAALALAVSAEYDGVDVLVHNAALVGPAGRQITVDGNELTFQVNYLAPALLTRLLTGTLRTARGRVVAVSSVLHRTGNLNWADPHRERHYASVPAYAQSKLALSMFVRALAEQHSDITALSVHPGIVEGGLLPLYSRVGADSAGAAEILFQLSQPGTAIENGAYYEGLAPAAPSALVHNPDAVRRLWKLTTRLLGQHRLILPSAA